MNVIDNRLSSLSTFLDVLFALACFRVVQFLPALRDQRLADLPRGLFSLLASEPTNLERVAFGFVVVVYYWNRKNYFFSVLARSNGMLASLTIAAALFLFMFAYALIADPNMLGGPWTLFIESVSLAVCGVLSLLALHYAIRAGLTDPERRSAAERIAHIGLSSPLAAVAAMALSWSGNLIWTLSWFVLMPALEVYLGRTSRSPRS
jgi:uncharacterized membrane protein